VSSQKGRGWPLSIIGIFIFLSIMLFGILYISLKYVPVNKENVYQMGYQEVDKNYNELRAAQEQFETEYDVAFKMPKLSDEPVETMRVNGEKVYFDHCFALDKNNNTLAIRVSDKAGKAVSDATLSLLLTRFETSEFDQTITVASVDEGVYTSEAFAIDRPGRWKIVAKVSVGEKTGYFEHCVYAR
jgi:hypothetical protein